MESSFKKGYDKTVNADGSFVLSLKGQRRGAAKTSGYGVTYVCFFLLCVMMAFTITNKMSFGGSVAAYLLTTALIACSTWFVFYSVFKNLNTKNTSLQVKPSEGIVFEGKQLPFRDIQSIGVTHQTTANNLDGNAQVYAVTHGTNVSLTGWLPLALADAIAGEIKGASGIQWN